MIINLVFIVNIFFYHVNFCVSERKKFSYLQSFFSHESCFYFKSFSYHLNICVSEGKKYFYLQLMEIKLLLKYVFFSDINIHLVSVLK